MAIPKSHRASCHTAYQHYQIFHGHDFCCNDRYGSLFNVVYNTPMCHCGRSSSGYGFWGGIGMGFGMGIMNFLGGMFTNIFAGGLPSLGGGGSNRNRNVNNEGDRGNGNKKCEDKDLAKINELWDEYDKVTDKDAAKKLYDKVKKLAKKPIDDEHKDDNIIKYNRIMKALADKWKVGDNANISEEQAADGAAAASQVGNGLPPAKVGNETAGNVTPEKVKIGDQDVDLETISNDDLMKLLNEDSINKLEPKVAQDILKKLGALSNDLDENDKPYAKVTTDYKVLLLIQKSGLKLKACNNTSLSGENAYIRGTITGVEYDEDNKATRFKIITDNGAYQMLTGDNKLTLLFVVTSDVYKMNPEYYDDGVEYKIENGEYAERSGSPALKKK